MNRNTGTKKASLKKEALSVNPYGLLVAGARLELTTFGL